MAIQFQWTGDAKAALQENAKLEKANTRLMEKIQKLTKESQKGGREQQRLAREAKKVYDQTRTPAERYRQKLQQLNELVKKGAIDEDTRRRAAAKAYDQMTAGSERAKQSGRGLGGVVKQGTASSQNMVVGLVGVQQTVGLVKRAYAEWRQEMAEVAKGASKLTKDLIRDMTEAGDLLHGPRITRATEEMEGVTREEARQLIAGVRGAAPRLEIGRVIDIAEAGAPVAALKSGEGLEEFTRLAGHLATMMPEKSAGDISDLALKMQQEAGDRISKLTSDQFRASAEIFKKAGIGTERLLAYELASVRAGIRPDTLTSAIEKATLSVDQMPEGTPARFVEAGVQERLKMLTTDEQLRRDLMGARGLKLGALSPELVVRGSTIPSGN